MLTSAFGPPQATENVAVHKPSIFSCYACSRKTIKKQKQNQWTKRVIKIVNNNNNNKKRKKRKKN